MREILSGILVSFALCLSLVVMPAEAAGYTSSAWAYDDTLTVYGNANLDDVIDETDIEYVRGIIDGTKDETQFADANYDGQIGEDDIAQIERIIAGEEDYLVILDMANRIVTVPMPVERIVLAGGVDSIRTLVMLGAEDKIVGCGYPSRWDPIWYAAPELEDLPDTSGGGNSFNVELAVSLEPDVIFVWTWDNRYNADEIQEKSQVPTIAVCGYQDSLWVADMFRIIGAVTGNDEKARDLITYTKEKVDEIKKITSDIPDEDKPVVYCTAGSGEITSCCGALSCIEFAGGLNAVEFTGSSFQISKEQIIKWSPDVILILFGSREMISEVLSDPVLQNVNAVKNRRVYSIRIGLSGWGALGAQLSSLNYLAKLFHPDKFENLDVEEEGNEIMKHLYGVDGLYTEMAEEYNFYRWD
ncbi:MAG: ABC transporter substrate-binding protein [Methanothrix sp.]|uniref:ABC transporter, iron siderophore/cobalamin periplasmic-binding domain family n=1 Tax=Methanothrix harundinacea TaxID=301375 RepID=A0A117LFK9_9EURY|nr:MAG: ABC transporter, iron siderophore/cobalamin periplasmic-binding domain family [Methanothrix harundinacea]MCP1393449.1 ABC transporter substrate-binding protein [Methanothrix harundinacea]MDD3709499.1 ABC transporter substrate-binding protein [Methanothrix sp.]MDD5767633.1 ABC transporter substrate-binding protein [Methanothrix sp.]